MLDCEVHSEEDDVDSYTLDIAHILENGVHDNSDLSESEKNIDIAMLDILVAQLVSEANEYGIEVKDNIYRNDARYTSHPIPQGLWKDINEFPQMRIISGKSPEWTELSFSRDLNSEPGKVTEERIWNFNKPFQNDTEHSHLREKVTESLSTDNPDDVSTNRKVVLWTVESKKSFLGGSLSSRIPTSPTSTEENEGGRMWSTQPNVMTGSSIACTKRDADKKKKKKLTKSILRRFDLMHVTQMDVFPPKELKWIPTDECARRIADISEKLEHYIPEKAWCTPPSDRFARRSRQGELSVPKSVSTFASSMSTADIFDLSLVNDISTEHSYLKPSYLKPSSSRGLCRTGKSDHLLPRYARQSSYPFVSTEARFSGLANSESGGRRCLNPFEADESRRYLEFETPTEDNSWFSSVFRNIGLSKFL